MHGRKHLYATPIAGTHHLCINAGNVFCGGKLVCKFFQLKFFVIGKFRHTSTVNAMGIADDGTYLCLTKDVFQTNNGHLLTTDYIFKYGTSANGRKLVNVTHENQTTTSGHSLEQVISQANVQHRGFVDDDCLCVQRLLIILTKVKATAIRLILQKTMYGQRRMSGTFSQTSGSTTSRRRQ